MAMAGCCFHGLELKILIMHLRKDYEEVGIETAEGGLQICGIYTGIHTIMSHTCLHRSDLLLHDSILFGFLIFLHHFSAAGAFHSDRRRRGRRLWRRILDVFIASGDIDGDAVRNVGGSRKHGTILHVRLFHAAALFSLRKIVLEHWETWDMTITSRVHVNFHVKFKPQ